MGTLITIKKPTKKEIKDFFSLGVQQTLLTSQLTETIKRDFFHRDLVTNQSKITAQLDSIINLESDDKEVVLMVKDVKRFVKKSLQTIIKNKACQVALLGDDVETKKVSLKKVNNTMIENEGGVFDGNFTDADYGSYRVVIESKKKKQDDTLIEALIKFMDSHEVDTSEVRDLTLEIDAGVTQ